MVDFAPNDMAPLVEVTEQTKAAAAATVRRMLSDPQHQDEVLECLGLIPTVHTT